MNFTLLLPAARKAIPLSGYLREARSIERTLPRLSVGVLADMLLLLASGSQYNIENSIGERVYGAAGSRRSPEVYFLRACKGI
jgi:hypothetical protein